MYAVVIPYVGAPRYGITSVYVRMFDAVAMDIATRDLGE